MIKENSTVYLRSGQAANFVKKIDDDNYIIEPFMIFYNYEGDEDYEHGDKIVVSEIFSKPPVEKIEKEYLEKIEAVKKKIGELSSITREVQSAERKLRSIKEKTTDLKEGIFNKSELINADSITVFIKGDAEPKTLSEKMKKSLKITLEINFINGEEKGHAYSFYDYEDNWSSGDKIDLDFGLMLDISEDELLKLSKARSERMYDAEDWSDYRLKRMDDIYLSDRLVELKNKMINDDKLQKKETIKSDIESKRKELRKLEQSLR